jgi:hypothetical protein
LTSLKSAKSRSGISFLLLLLRLLFIWTMIDNIAFSCYFHQQFFLFADILSHMKAHIETRRNLISFIEYDDDKINKS